MATLIYLASALLVLVGLALIAHGVVTRRRAEPERTVECVGLVPGDAGELPHGCGLVLPVSAAHIVAEILDDEGEPSWGGGGAMVAEYCAEHCPGGCNQAHAA